MARIFIRKIFPLLALTLLAPWPVAYAYDIQSAGHEPVRIEAAEASTTPGWRAFGGAIGSAAPGNLFYIDTAGNADDVTVTLYLTNTAELVQHYRYLILKVAVYAQGNSGEWEKASWHNGEPVPDTFITLRNGRVSFALAGYGKYKVAIDGGSFYCFTTGADRGGASPRFYLTVDEL